MSIQVQNNAARILAPILFGVAFPLLAVASTALSIFRNRGASFKGKGKVIIVTGASSGIGESLSKLYAKEGGILVLVARRKEQLEKVAEECKKLGAEQVIVEIVDVSIEEQVKGLMDRTGARFGSIDLLVLNAGVSMGSALSTFSDVSAFRRIMEVNYIGSAAGALYALPYLKRAVGRGKIVVVSSVLYAQQGIIGGPNRTGYCASKFALKGFFDSLRLEEPDIDITMIYPGIVKTEINQSRLGPGEEIYNLNMEKAMTADDAAKIIVQAVQYNVKDEVYTLPGKIGWFIKDLFPALRDWLMNKQMRASFKKRA
ncbi:hypothetical protein HDU97_000696 [Phlyctochytrium planicorne]|nr:hypothetical protein HDU97_000696 [Phlyctochytrium planicorne]